MATAALPDPGASFRPALVVAGIADRSQVGFTNLVIPKNGPVPTKYAKTPLGQQVEQEFMEGVRRLFSAFSLTNQGVPTAGEVDIARQDIAAALEDFADAAALPG